MNDDEYQQHLATLKPPKIKRGYRKIAPEHLAFARKRFGEFASTSAVRAELRAMGAEYSHSALHHYWHAANKARAA